MTGTDWRGGDTRRGDRIGAVTTGMGHRVVGQGAGGGDRGCGWHGRAVTVGDSSCGGTAGTVGGSDRVSLRVTVALGDRDRVSR